MYPLDSIARVCDKQICNYEKRENALGEKNQSLPYTRRGESNTQALVRCVSKLFHETQYCCSQELITYLKEVCVLPEQTSSDSVIYYRFVGNRFHVYFFNSGLLYLYEKSSVRN